MKLETRLDMHDVSAEVEDEVERQYELWGEQNHPDGTGGWYGHDAWRWKRKNEIAVLDGKIAWDLILLEEVYEALAESDPEKLREELIQVAAVAVQWAMAIDRRTK